MSDQPGSGSPFPAPEGCMACYQRFTAYVDDLENRHGEVIEALKSRVEALNIYVGTEEGKTGMFGAIERAFEEVRAARADIQNLTAQISARDNQIKGLGMAGKAIWALISVGGLTALTNIVYLVTHTKP